jgi:hypothetical protein
MPWVIALMVVALIAAACGDSGDATTTTTTAPAGTTAPATTTAADTAPDATRPPTDPVEVTTPMLWISNLAGKVTKVDPDTGQVVAEIPVGLTPSTIVYGHGAIWVTDCSSGNVHVIDPVAATVVAEVAITECPWDISVAPLGLWTSSRALAGSVARISRTMEAVVQDIPVGENPTGLSAGSLYVGHEGGELWIFDEFGSFLTSLPVNGVIQDVISYFGAVWVVVEDGRVVQVDPAANTIAAESMLGAGQFSAAGGEGFVFVPVFSQDQLWYGNPVSQMPFEALADIPGVHSAATGPGTVYAVSRPTGDLYSIDLQAEASTPVLIASVGEGSHTIAAQPRGPEEGGPQPGECTDALQQVNAPAEAIAAALEFPTRVSGWGQPANRDLPYDAERNPPKTLLSAFDANQPYDPETNPLIYDSFCP